METPLSRPRRSGANYGSSMTPSRSPSVNIAFTYRRKGLIRDFQEENKTEIGSRRWVRNLFRFLSSEDDKISMQDLRRWIEKYPWITAAEGRYPATPMRMITRSSLTATPATANRQQTVSATLTTSPDVLQADQENAKRRVNFRQTLDVKMMTPMTASPIIPERKVVRKPKRAPKKKKSK